MVLTVINKQSDLEEAFLEWRKERILAIDLEAENNLHHYGTKLSIIQISTRSGDWIIDVLALKDLTPIKKLFEDSYIVKVFHDVSFDFRILNQYQKITPKNIFDTSIAAQLLGYKQVGLGSLLEKFFGVVKEKKFQKADWTKRPLNREMLEYAAGDTKYLIKLKEVLEKELLEKNRLDWAKEEFNYLEKHDYREEPLSFTDIKGTGKLNPTQLSVLKEIYDVREKLAKSLDKPVYFVINNKLLLDLAQNPPKSEHTWKALKGVHPAVKSSSKLFQKAVNKGLKSKVTDFNKKGKFKRMTKAQQRRFDELDEVRKKISKQLGIEGHWLLDRYEMIDLAVGGSITSLKRWQQKLLLEEFNA